MRDFMEADLNPRSRAAASQGRSLPLVLSGILHGVLLVILCWQPGPLFVKPRLLAKGQGGTLTPASMPLYIPQDLAAVAPHEPALLSLPVPARQARNTKAKLEKRSNVLERDQPADEREAGSRQGTSFDGPSEGDEVKQGFAIMFAPPHVSRWELPHGTEGDVIVELTIDAEGNVVEEKLLQGLGPNIDGRVMAAVRDWHFRPATRNGVAIPFKYDARFHFPS
ncbi:MAG TPA: energy transducer TonB [Terriglobales bacterium]